VVADIWCLFACFAIGGSCFIELSVCILAIIRRITLAGYSPGEPGQPRDDRRHTVLIPGGYFIQASHLLIQVKWLARRHLCTTVKAQDKACPVDKPVAETNKSLRETRCLNPCRKKSWIESTP